ncbi:flavohemoprotein [Rhodoferax lithotrophicus]|uniref:Flavohemoprotein n=1 Tax=Rhodoferax lithotrophicus TaxID=2798804 RepID=A0ABN6D733_9BURK|nr:ferric reductase-like transmembrane domain-containing protein [Rhodoferax sp. MIZ03]BCO27832.1 flavohemoprotein [Rhodoferax sp. MIZ03]
MKHIQRFYLGLIVTFTLLWLWADSAWLGSSNYFVWRTAFTNWTGLLGMVAMSVGMILSVRPIRVEPHLGGLDKMYRLHKWLGITGLVLSVSHWALAKSPRYLIDLGWIERPGPRVRGPLPEGLEGLFLSQRKLAETLGEYAFYVLCALLLLALIKRFPYKHFFKTHRWMAVVYLVLVVHAVVLMKFSFWNQGVGPLSAVLMVLGSAAAVVSLLRRVGIHRRAVGVIEALEHHPESGVLRVDVRLQDRWDGHDAGQFAFVTFDDAEGQHPFTISSAWHNDGHLFFLIKEGGDYTSTLPSKLKVGELCTVEGPYGRFVFNSDVPRQIWVAGGIGITPFIARMQALAKQGHDQPVDLFWSVRVLEDEALRRVQANADKAQVRLHIIRDGQNDPLTAQRITTLVPSWAQGDVWFCGPAGFGSALREGFGRLGLGSEHFHQELFQMR